MLGRIVLACAVLPVGAAEGPLEHVLWWFGNKKRAW